MAAAKDQKYEPGATAEEAALRERMNLYPIQSDIAAQSYDEQLVYWRERQRRLLWAITKMEQKLSDWERNGITRAEQLDSARRAERERLSALFAASNPDASFRPKKKVVRLILLFRPHSLPSCVVVIVWCVGCGVQKEIFEVATCEQLLTKVIAHVMEQKQLPVGGKFIFCGFVGSRQCTL